MTSRQKMLVLRWLRRSVQGGCFAVFLWTVVVAARGSVEETSKTAEIFFLFDPLVMLTTIIASRAFTALLLLGLITMALTVVFGRFFCGWICPLGSIHATVSALRKDSTFDLVQREKWSPWNRWKYYILIGMLVGAAFGANWIGLLDPFSLLYRTTFTVFGPAIRVAVEDGSTAIYQSDPHIGPVHATMATEPAYRFFRDHVFVANRQSFYGGVLISAVFLITVGLNFYRKRFWCRYLCPLGALLGLAAWRPWLRMRTCGETCTECGLCRVNCQGAGTPDKPGEWRPSECFLCLNCTAKCNWDAITFTVQNPLRGEAAPSVDLSRRAAMTAGLVGAGTLLSLRLSPVAQGKVFDPNLVRPPGALAESEFLSRCVRCGLCMRVCPTNGLQPAGFDTGIEGLWTPRLVAQVGYCEYECNRCGAVCPTEAIQPLDMETKKATKLGLASFDTSRCLPYAYGRECMVCEEHCPISTKAIHFIETEVKMRDGSVRVLKQPRVDPERCIGCGICEAKCVFRDQPAIRVTSANETRHPNNQPILSGFTLYDAPPVESGGGDPYG
ncbi:MAG: 4Fe-4S binding protein [Candidatus Hydrogenedentes bacterium]|nr:4Fe-4S binding protein [Candidatus Hydrogenedentota bacterium]